MTARAATKPTATDLALTVERAALLRVLASAARVTCGRSTMPILGFVLLTAEGDRLSLMATDLEIGITAHVPATITTAGVVAVNARSLHDIVKQLPGDEVTFRRDVDGSFMCLTSGRSKFRLLTLNASDFPTLPQPDAPKDHVITIDAPVLADMIDRVGFATSNDGNRLSLCGALCETPTAGELRLTTTNGHRLARVSRAVPKLPKLNGSVIIPSRGLVEARKLLDGDGAVRLVVGMSTAFLMLPDAVLSMRLIEGAFPDVAAAIPKQHKRTLRVNATALLAAVRRVALMNSATSRAICLELRRDELEVSAKNTDTGEARETLPASYDGDDFSISLSSAYVLDVLGVGSAMDEVAVGFNTELEPVTLTFTDDAQFAYVLMPVRL